MIGLPWSELVERNAGQFGPLAARIDPIFPIDQSQNQTIISEFRPVREGHLFPGLSSLLDDVFDRVRRDPDDPQRLARAPVLFCPVASRRNGATLPPLAMGPKACLEDPLAPVMRSGEYVVRCRS